MQRKRETLATLRNPPRPGISKAIVALGLFSVSSPNLATSSHYLASAPGLNTTLALSIALVMSLALILLADSGVSRIERSIMPACAVSSLALLGYELLCRALEYLWLDWEYVGVQPPIGLIAQALRGATAALILAHLVHRAQNGAAHSNERGNRESTGSFAALVPTLLCACAGFVWYASSETLHVDAPLASFDAIRTATLIGWCCTFLIYALAVWQAHRIQAYAANARTRWLAASPFFWGALLANMLLRVAHVANLPFALPHEWHVALACFAPAACIGTAACVPLIVRRKGQVPRAIEAQPSHAPEQRRSSSPSSAVDHALSLLPGFDQLTEREAETVSLALSCRSMADVAEALGIAPSTATTYRSRALAKLGISSQDALVAILVSGGATEADTESIPPASGLPQWGVASVALAPLLAAVILRVLPAIAACILISALALCTTLCGAIELARNQNEPGSDILPAWHTITSSMLIGSVLAYATVSLSQSSNVLDPLLSLGAIAAILHWTRRNRHLPASCRALALISTGCTGICCATAPALNLYPSEAGSILLLLTSIGIVLLAGEQHRSMEKELAGTDTEGNARPLSYLIGRGLNELESHVALLTARGYRTSAIAATLSISPATVSSYRSRSYRKLDVSGKRELEELLRKEAGLR